MLTTKEKIIIQECAKKYKVLSVFLFGSSVSQKDKANDIDLGVKGINPKLFFKFYAELFKRLPKPVDLIDLSKSSLFTSLIERNGVKIYG